MQECHPELQSFTEGQFTIVRTKQKRGTDATECFGKTKYGQKMSGIT